MSRMIGEVSGIGFNNEPDEEFLKVLDSVRIRFDEAVAEDRPGYMHFTITELPRAPGYIGVFALASSYREMVEGRSETFRLGVPLQAFDIRRPVAATDKDHKFFTLGFPGDEAGDMVLWAADYQRVFQGGERPPITDFEQKLVTYQIVPLRKTFTA